MKLYALTSIEADDKDQKKCMWACDHLDLTDISPWCKLFQAWLSNEPLRCPACLAASAVHPLIEEIGERSENRVTDNYKILKAVEEYRNLKGKLK